MLAKVSVGTKDLQRYRLELGNELIDEIEKLAYELKDVRMCHINSTPFGGGVAELLSSYIPLVRSLGLTVDWQVMRGDRAFFEITKCIHNALQGDNCGILAHEKSRRRYMAQNEVNARELDYDYDVFIVNDPQPAALRHFIKDTHNKWIWRCHIDTSGPDDFTWNFLRSYIEQYDAAIFTMSQFVPQDLVIPRTGIMAPAIDAYNSKNMLLPRGLCREMASNLGIDRERPLILQVSRFDPWKDPFGVIEIFRLAREQIPGLQLALVGSLACDDPEGLDIFAEVNNIASQDDDMFVFTNLTGVGSMEVNAFQTACNVVIQKSIKEGFGLVVSEALWKGTPVVGGNAGGIPMQMTGNLSNYLASSVEDFVEKVVYLLENKEIADQLGKEGRENVIRNFLMPRLIRDELALVKAVVES
ncbi:MAG: glycosyltransferase [Chloroflexota bacterium]|nr:glycosyltransferase [Chloroflexota bacterium]